MIVREDEPARRLYMIVAGKVLLSFETAGAFHGPAASDANQAHIRTLTEPGRIIGWSALVEPYHYRATATAIEDTHLLAFNVDGSSAAQRRIPSLASN